ncbi:hypothetical protein H0H92_011163 [Tricholoma furcatifolium]|nr:hypothetical protein H0H92_011163 [Tricholoma furcatifolium]
MHTLDQPGVNVERVENLIKNYIWTQQETSILLDNDLVGPETISLHEIDAEFAKLDANAPAAEDGDHLPGMVQLSDVYDLTNFDSIRSGQVILTMEKQFDISRNEGGSNERWDPKSIMESLGL